MYIDDYMYILLQGSEHTTRKWRTRFITLFVKAPGWLSSKTLFARDEIARVQELWQDWRNDWPTSGSHHANTSSSSCPGTDVVDGSTSMCTTPVTSESPIVHAGSSGTRTWSQLEDALLENTHCPKKTSYGFSNITVRKRGKFATLQSKELTVNWKYVAESFDCPDGVRLPEGLVETCEFENSNVPSGGEPRPKDIGRFENANTDSNSKSERCREDKWMKQVEVFMGNHITVPIRNALCISEWRAWPGHINVNRESFKIKNIIDDLEFKYLSYTIRDFYDLYSTSDKIIYFKCLTMEEYNRKYLGIRGSVLSILELLYFQFNFNMLNVDSFLNRIYKMCDFRQNNI